MLDSLFYLDTMLTSVTTKKNRSVRHPQHTQTNSNSSTIAADISNGYVHHSLFNRTYCILRKNVLSTTIFNLIFIYALSVNLTLSITV